MQVAEENAKISPEIIIYQEKKILHVVIDGMRQKCYGRGRKRHMRKKCPFYISNASIPDEVNYTNNCSEGDESNEGDMQEEVVSTVEVNTEIVEERKTNIKRKRVDSPQKRRRICML